MGVTSLECLLEQSYPSAYRTAWLILHNRADADEAVQEAFLRAWRFRAAAPSGDDVRPWLYRVVVNTCLSRLRSDARRRARAGAVAPEEAFEHDVIARQVVAEALGRLPVHLRVVVVLRYYVGLSEAEIAIAIRRRPGTVKSRLHEARQRLSTDPALSSLAGVSGVD
jgi:RNA polymerase sigma-70 factor (ECF subfamily)